MSRSTIAMTCFLFVWACLPSAADERAKQPKKPNDAAERSAAKKWLEGLGDKGPVLNENRARNGFVVKPGRGAIGRHEFPASARGLVGVGDFQGHGQ